LKSGKYRYLDIQIRMPRTLYALEPEIKKLIGESVNRGKINCSINLDDNSLASDRLKLNTEIADMYYKIFSQLKSRYKLTGEFETGFFINLPDIINAEIKQVDLESVWSEIKPVIAKALAALVRMRKAEGKNIQTDFNNRLKILNSVLLKIKKIASGNAASYREKLQQRIEELLEDYPVDKQRIAAEAAIIAEKMDITEELIRFESHLKSFKIALDKKGAIGKKLAFILQEMHREVNTMGSKANDYDISTGVISIKDELEKLREQALNIE